MGIKWLPLAGYTLPIFNADQSNGLKMVIQNRITEIRAYGPESQASPPRAESFLREKKFCPLLRWQLNVEGLVISPISRPRARGRDASVVLALQIKLRERTRLHKSPMKKKTKQQQQNNEHVLLQFTMFSPTPQRHPCRSDQRMLQMHCGKTAARLWLCSCSVWRLFERLPRWF